ncbi:hypothetical protein BC628DRAFT_1394570 [Trametes gibbosa]|nr:hypothetical protein BC628DRAFT_1394570 [Trametes gibbosa]
MHLTIVFKSLYVLAHVGLVVGTPTALQTRQTCDILECMSVEDCGPCPNIPGGWTCASTDRSGLDACVPALKG